MPVKIPSSTPQRRKILLRVSRLMALAALTLSLSASHAQSKTFVKKYKPLVDSLSEVYGIPAAVILGISIIESSSGTSRNCKLLNNYFGIVGKNNLKKTKGIKTRYKQYADAAASFEDFCKVISRKKFYKKLKGNTHYRIWLDSISKSGYSEAPTVWKQRITGAIQMNRLSSTP